MFRSKMFFHLNEFCILVHGKARSALYNLLDGNVYSLPEESSKILINEKSSIGNILKNGEANNIHKNKTENVINEIKNLGLGRISNKNLFIDKVAINFGRKYGTTQRINLEKIIIQLNNSCDLDCNFCESNSTNSKYCFPCSRDTGISNTNALMNKFNELLSDISLLKCENVRFTGGDPLKLGDDFIDILKIFIKKIENIEVFSNLSSLSHRQLIAFQDMKDLQIIFPIFGSNEKSFNNVTGNPHAFKNVLKNAMVLKEKNVKISALVLKRKDERADQVEKLLKLMQIKYKYYSPIPIKKLNNEMTNIFDGHWVKSGKFQKVNYIDFYTNKIFNNCMGGKISINSKGDVMPCLFANDIIYGNIFQKGLKDILREGHQDQHWEFTKDKRSGCKICEYRYCCSADCIISSKRINGKLSDIYPFCKYDPFIGKWKTNEK